MAKNIINVQEQIDKNLTEFITKLKYIDAEIIKISQSARGTNNIFSVKTPSGLNSSLKERSNFTQQLNAYTKERVAIEKALIKQTNKVMLAEQGVSDALVKQRYEMQELNKRAKQSAVLSSTLSSKYTKLSTVLNLMRNKYKDLAIQYGENSKQAKRLLVQITALDNRLKRIDGNVGQFQRSVGNYGKAMNSATKAARNLAGALGFVGGAFLAVQVIRDAFETVREFDKQVIAVQKTTNLTNPEIKLFKEEVIDLGLALKGVSIQGLLKSSEVAGQLGVKGRKNILKFSEVIEKLKLTSDIVGDESVRNFAKFIEVSEDTVENADRLGSVITELGNNFATTENQILSNSTEIQKALAIYDASAEGVLGLGAATSALGSEAEQSRSALQKTFKVLNDGAATGKNLERILKITGQTAEEFTEEFGRDSVKTFQRFVSGLSDSAKEGKNLSITLKELGLDEKRTEAVVGVLAKNYDLLEDSLKRANNEYEKNSALNKEAALAAESLDAKIGDLSDSWDGLVLTIESGDGAISKAIKSFIGEITKLLDVYRKVEKAQDNVFKVTGQSKGFLDYLKQLNPLTSLIESDFDNLVEKQREFNALANDLDGQKTVAYKDAISSLNHTLSTNNDLSDDMKLLYENQIKVFEDVIKSRETETDKITENTEATINNTEETEENNNSKNKGKVILEGSIKAYEAVISQLKDEQSRLATTTDEYKSYNDQIKEAQEQIKLLTKGMIELAKYDGEGLEFDFESKGLNRGGFENFQIEEAKRLADEEIENEKEKYKILKDLGKDFYGFLSDLGLGNIENIKSLSQEEISILRDAFQAQKDLRKELSESTKELAFSTIDGIAQKRVEDVENEISINNDRYSQLLDNENLTEEQRSSLEAERDRKQAVLQKKKEKREKQAFLVNQGIAIADIAINLAKTISAINLAAATIDAVTLGFGGKVYRAANIPLAIGNASVQTGVILAQSLPAFEKGKGNYDNYEGAAIWGEKRREVKISKDGNIEISPRKIGNHLTHVKKDDVIHPDANKFFNDEVGKYAIYASINNQNASLDSYIMARSYEQTMKQQTDRMIKAVEKKNTKINLHNHNSISEDMKFMFRLNNTL